MTLSGGSPAVEAQPDGLERVLPALQAMAHVRVLGSPHLPAEVGEIEVQALSQDLDLVRVAPAGSALTTCSSAATMRTQ
jgi:hypothetical protein